MRIQSNIKLGTAARIAESYGFGARQSNTATSWNIDSWYSNLVVLFLSCNTEAETNLIAPKELLLKMNRGQLRKWNNR